MLDDLRNHDPVPTEKERGWMDTSPVEAAVRVAIVVGVSVAIGVAASLAPDNAPRPSTAAALAAH
jgi:hypothetical protein